MSYLMIIAIWLVLFAATLLAVSSAMKYLETERRRKVSGMLAAIASTVNIAESAVLKGPEQDRKAGLATSFAALPLVKQWERIIAQSGLNWTVPRLLALTLLGGVAGLLIGSRVSAPMFRELAWLAAAGLLGAAPGLYVWRKRTQRLARFEEQFPESLDFLARSMRAGHALSVSLEMLADEAPQPLALEFRRVFHEQNLGAPMEEALRNLAERVPLLDVKFFVSAVLMQRETGGNLAEILTKLAYVIRERFRLKGQVRAMSAHGRLTAMILTLLPIATMTGLLIVAPGYLSTMARDPDGKILIAGAICGQFLGYFLMRRIIDIKV